MAKYETVYADGKKKRTKKPKVVNKPSGAKPVASASPEPASPPKKPTAARRVLDTSRVIPEETKSYKVGQAVGRTMKKSPTARVARTLSKPVTGAAKLVGKPALALSSKVGSALATAPVQALTGLPLVADTAVSLGQATVTPAIRKQQEAQMAAEAAYPGQFPDPMAPEAQQAAGQMAWGRTGHMFQGAAAPPATVSMALNPATGMMEPFANENPEGMVSTTRHMYEGLPALNIPALQEQPPVPVEQEQAPVNTSETQMTKVEQEAPVPAPTANYEFNPVTRKFEAQPYEPQAIQNRSISDVLGNTRLSGLGGLYAINLASKMAKSEAAQNAFNEKQRQQGAKSALDWKGLSLDNDKLALAEALAPSEFVRNMSAAENYRASAKGQMTKSENQKLKFSEALIKEAGDLMQKAAELRANGMPDQALIIEEQANALFEGDRLTETQAYTPAVTPNILARLFGAKAEPEKPRLTQRTPIDFKKLY